MFANHKVGLAHATKHPGDDPLASAYGYGFGSVYVMQSTKEDRKPCVNWLRGNCTNESCRFAHGEGKRGSDPHATLPGTIDRKPCVNWLRGNCTNESCRFAHGEGKRGSDPHATLSGMTGHQMSSPNSHLHQLLISPSKNKLEMCIVCSQPVSSYIRCALGHCTCDNCLTKYVTITWANQHPQIGAKRELSCCSAHCGAPPFRTAEVARHCTDEAFQVYFDVVQSAKDAVVYAESQKLLHDAIKSISKNNSTASSDADGASTELFQRQLRSQFRDALMCPQCNFGPVLLQGCHDLHAHHLQPVGRTCIDNRCPICGFLAETAEEWTHWDGVVRDLQPQAQALAARPQPARSRPTTHETAVRLAAAFRCPVEVALLELERSNNDPNAAAERILDSRDRRARTWVDEY